MKLVDVKTKSRTVRLHPSAAEALSRAVREQPDLEVVVGTLHLFEFLSRQRPGMEPKGFAGFSGHLFGLCLDFQPPPADREENLQALLRAFGWVALDPGFPWHLTYAGHNWKNYVTGGEAARVLEAMRPELDTVDPRSVLVASRLLPEGASPATLREALFFLQRTFGIEETGGPCLRTRAVLLSLHG